jgi:hypothetical protein
MPHIDGPEIIATVSHDQSGLRRGIGRSEANGDRICRCVNACAGITDPQSAIAAARDALKELLYWMESHDAEETMTGCAVMEEARQALEGLG